MARLRRSLGATVAAVGTGFCGALTKTVRLVKDGSTRFAALNALGRVSRNDPHRRGPKRAPDLLDVVDVLLATGARIGEVLAIRWQDIDLSSERPRLTITGTVVHITDWVCGARSTRNRANGYQGRGGAARSHSGIAVTERHYV